MRDNTFQCYNLVYRNMPEMSRQKICVAFPLLVCYNNKNHNLRKAAYSMDKWEYRIVIVRASLISIIPDGEKALKELGNEGWELVCVNGYLHYFKRRIPS